MFHSTNAQELDSCFLDPLALPQHDLLAQLNQNVGSKEAAGYACCC